MSLSWLLVAVACLIGAEPSFSQTVNTGDALTEVTILKHSWSFDRRFTSARKTNPESDIDAVGVNIVTLVSVKLRNNTAKKIIGVTWYLVTIKAGSKEELTRMRFSSHTQIEAKKTATVKGEIERWPRVPRAGTVTVDALKTKVVGPPKERVLISCLLFADGSFSSLDKSSNSDCQSLVSLTKGTTMLP